MAFRRSRFRRRSYRSRARGFRRMRRRPVYRARRSRRRGGRRVFVIGQRM